jgi:hypothetical protein
MRLRDIVNVSCLVSQCLGVSKMSFALDYFDVIGCRVCLFVLFCTATVQRKMPRAVPILKDNQLVGLATLTDKTRATSCDKKTIDPIEALSKHA